MTSNIDHLKEKIALLKEQLAAYEFQLVDEMKRGPVYELAKLLQVELAGIPCPVEDKWFEKSNRICSYLRAIQVKSFPSDHEVLTFMRELVDVINE